MRTARGYAPLIVLVAIAFFAFSVGKTFSQAMVIISVLGWISVVVLFVYLVLFRGVKLSLFKDTPAPDVKAFNDEVDSVVPVTGVVVVKPTIEE